MSADLIGPEPSIPIWIFHLDSRFGRRQNLGMSNQHAHHSIR